MKPIRLKQTVIPNGFIGIAIASLAWFCWLMAKTVFIYVPFNEDAGFLILKSSWVTYDWWKLAFQIHVYSSGVAMLAGFTQFWNKFNSASYTNYARWHRWMGYVYVLTILALALPSGLVLALTALGGLPVRISFTVLCILWAMTTAGGVYFAIKRQFKIHRTLMVYSYALTLSAVTLRFLKLGLYQISPYFDWLTPMHIYQTESVLAWGINLIIAWFYLNSNA